MKTRKTRPVELLWLNELRLRVRGLFHDDRRVYFYKQGRNSPVEHGWTFSEDTIDIYLDLIERLMDNLIVYAEMYNPDIMLGIINELVDGDFDKAKEDAKAFLATLEEE